MAYIRCQGFSWGRPYTAGAEEAPLAQASTAGLDDKTIGRRLQALRKRRGLSQAELAGTLGLTQPRISQYERGEVRMSGPLVAAFAKALRTSPNEILGFEKIKRNGSLDRRFLRRLEEIEALSRRDKQALLRTIERFVRRPDSRA